MQNAALVEFAEWDPDDLTLEANDRLFIELREGANYFGKDPWNHIVLKGNSVAQYAGILFVKDSKVFLRAASGQQILHNNKPVEGDYVYSGERGSWLSCGSHRFRVVLERGKIGIEFS